MPEEESHSFTCTICASYHLHFDCLPIPYSGHKPHCILCFVHKLYRSIIPAPPPHRQTSEEREKKAIISLRKGIICINIPIIVLAYFAIRRGMPFWQLLIGAESWQERIILGAICLIALAPAGCLIFAILTGVYYFVGSFVREKAKCDDGHAKVGEGALDLDSISPIQDRPLTSTTHDELEGSNDDLEVVVTPLVEPRVETVINRANRVSRMLRVVGDRFKGGYDGRAVRRESWQMEDLSGGREHGDNVRGEASKKNRPVTVWPEM